jgi:hypothetical protein
MTTMRERRGRRTVFLSGMIDGLPIAESSSWRQEAARVLGDLGFDTYDPTRVILASQNYRPTANEVFTNDRWNLARADVLLVNLCLPPMIESQKAPFFTIGEMFLAHAAGLPIIAFGSCFRGRAGYEAIVTRSFDALPEALRYIADHYA